MFCEVCGQWMKFSENYPWKTWWCPDCGCTITEQHGEDLGDYY